MSTARLDGDPAARAAALVTSATRVVVLTGAGISTDSGIPDFRGPQGLWTKDPSRRRVLPLESYLADAEARRAGWRSRLAAPVFAARPNVAHLALLDLDRRGALQLLITQNTDGLHLAAGHLPRSVVELHGTVHATRCLDCGSTVPTVQVLDRVRAGDDDPHCAAGACGGVLKVATVGFGQSLDRADLERAVEAVRRCEVLVAVGSTLTVDPAAALVPTARRAGAAVVIVNGAPTRHDGVADVVVRGPIAELLPPIVGAGDGESQRPWWPGRGSGEWDTLATKGDEGDG